MRLSSQLLHKLHYRLNIILVQRWISDGGSCLPCSSSSFLASSSFSASSAPSSSRGSSVMSSASSSSSSSSVVLAESFPSLPSDPDSDSSTVRMKLCVMSFLISLWGNIFTFAIVLVFTLSTLLVVLEEDGRNESLQVHQVLIKVTSVFIFPDPSLQVILSGFTRGENINARTVFWDSREKTTLLTKKSYDAHLLKYKQMFPILEK